MIRALMRKLAAVWLGATALFGAAAAQIGPYENTTVAAINSSTTCSAPVTRTITVGQSFTISDLDVGFLATHTWRTDVQLDLRSPAGTTVRLINAPANLNYNNYNVLLDDEAATLINNGSHAASDGTAAPPYENNVRPNNALSAFDGQNAAGAWTLTICDTYPSADHGQFVRANLYFNTADLSLTKTSSTATPSVNTNFTYTITVANAGPTTASGVVVKDLLPAGLTYVSDNGAGAYVSGPGLWTVPGTIASGASKALQITAKAVSAGTFLNGAEVTASNNSDIDSTPNNGGAAPFEDDTASVSVSVGAADLSLTMTPSTTTPAINTNYTYTLTLTNSGPSSTSGVKVKSLLPSGVTYVSDNGAGAYISGAGVWTIAGSIASGGTKTLQITAKAAAAGAYTNFAEVTASAAPDPDSTPNNSGSSLSEDDTSIVTVTVGGGGSGAPPTMTCSGASGQLDWDANAWPAGGLSQSYTASSVPFSFAFSGSTNRLITFGGSAMPATRTDLTGGLSPAQNSLLYVANFNNASETISVTLDVGSSGAGVAKMQFSIFDVDIATGGNGTGFVDQLQVTGSLGGSLVIPILTNGVANTTSGVTATGTASAGSTSANGTVVVTFLAPVDKVTITYGSGAGAPSNPGQQGIAVHDLNFCKTVGTATLIGSKTVAVYNPGGATPFAIPGNDVVYTISSTNIGTGPADANSIFIVDTLPAEVTFFNGDMDGAGPATGAVYFTQSGAGLTFTLATDVKYSSSATRPATFAACTYAPAAGYDASVKHVCLNPKGSMLAGSPNPSFTAQFRVRIK